MLRAVISRFAVPVVRTVYKQAIIQNAPALVAVAARKYHHVPQGESDEEFDNRYASYFADKDIDDWQCRKLMTDLCHMDLIPDPKIINAAMHACRRLNDYALAVRFLEAIKDKCGSRVKEIWPYVIQEIQPTLDELGILSPEQMGYDKPELALQDVDDL